MSFPYKKILILGATSGIGWALAEQFVSEGKSVIVTGRRKENLDKFVSQHPDKASAAVLDLTKLDQLPQFVAEITKQHPDIDCVLLNSGIQRGFDFSKPDTVDLNLLNEELTTNYLSYIHFTVAILPHLQKQTNPTALIYTTSGLALVPIPRCPNYCASKAALHHWILSLRTQLQGGPGDVKVVEIFPPAVQTELHDEKHQPDVKGGSKIGMPLKDFTEETWAALAKGEEEIPVGMAKRAYEAFEHTRRDLYQQQLEMFQKLLSGQ